METPDLEEVQRAVGARYEVLDLAGAGGMGAVFRARHRELQHLVAVKVLPPEIATSRVRQERFRREAQLAAHLAHPNIVPVYEFDSREGIVFLIMPFVDGRTLQTELQQRPRLPLADLLRIAADIGGALDFAHRRGVVHRDVKPANVLIERDSGRALLTDFGVALARSSAAGSLTAPGSAIGTPDYMAPEQAKGVERLDGRTDLYALALVAYEALTDELPAMGVDRDALAAALHARRPDVSLATATALVTPLAERPDERPPSAAAWLQLVARASARPWPRRIGAAAAAALVAGLAWLALGHRGTDSAAPRTLAVMPFTILGTNAHFPPAQLPTWFLQRLGDVPRLQIVSAAKVTSLTGGQPPVISEAESVAVQIGATYFVQPSLEFQDARARLTVRVYETKNGRLLGTGQRDGAPDSLSQIMDAVWAQVLPPIVRQNFAPTSSVTLPHSLRAMLAYANAEEAFRKGDYATALADYDEVLAADSGFAIAHFRRAIVLAQVDPREESLRQAISGAEHHQSGLAPADSLLLEGYGLLLGRGDGRAALERFKAAADLAPDQPQVWFVLGEFYYHFGSLFDEDITAAGQAFNTVLDLVPDFAPAIAHLISLAHLRGDKEETARLIAAYERFGTSSVVAEAVGIADTLIVQGVPARLKLLKTLRNHSFTALEYLAFQAQVFATTEERRGPTRDILRALEERATTDSQQVVALRFGVSADLGEGWRDSARVRLERARTPATQRERDLWLALLPAVGLDTLGDWRGATARLDRGFPTEREGGETIHWLAARLDVNRPRHVAALERLAADSAPLALALKLDLDARRALSQADTVEALRLWAVATRRYAVLRVGFDLVASLWPLRLDMVRVGVQHGDTAAARRACESFSSVIGYVDLVAMTRIERPCAPWLPPRR